MPRTAGAGSNQFALSSSSNVTGNAVGVPGNVAIRGANGICAVNRLANGNVLNKNYTFSGNTSMKTGA